MGTILTQDEQYEAYARGRENRSYAAEIVRLRDVAKRKRVPTREEITPPLQTEEERGNNKYDHQNSKHGGLTLNAQMVRLLSGATKKRSLFRRIFHLGVVLLLAGAVQAQEPKYTWVDGALTAGWAGVAVGDRWSTNRALTTCPTCREASPFKSANARMGIQFALLGTTEFLQHKYPEHRTKFRILKGVLIGFGAAVIINNMQKAR